LPSASLDAAGNFVVGPVEWTLPAGFKAFDFEFRGTFWGDGTGADDVYYKRVDDYRETAPLFNQTGEAACAALLNTAQPCESCPTDSEAFCATREVENVPLQDVGLASLVERTQTQIDNDTACH
jgi:hypothetical protein